MSGADPRIRVRADELNALRRLIKLRRQEQQDQTVLHELHELRKVKERLAILEDRLASVDAEFFGAAIDALRKADGRNA